MSLFRNLQLTRAVLSHCRTRTFIARNIGTLSALQKIHVANGSQLSQHLGHHHILGKWAGLYFQQPQRWLSSDINPADYPSVDYNGLIALLESGDIQLIDVRDPDELIEYGKMPKSLNIPLKQVEETLDMDPTMFRQKFQQVKPMPSDKNIVFSCLAGIRSAKALIGVTAMGYTQARHYPGGWEEWSEKQGLPLKKNETPSED